MDFLDIPPRLELRFGIPFTLFVGYLTMQIAKTITFLMNNHQLLCQFVYGWNKYFLGQLERRVVSITFTVSNKDLDLVSSYRKLQVLHRMAKNVLGSILFSIHHGVMMVLAIITLFVRIRCYEELSPISYVLFIIGAWISLTVPFCEFYFQYVLREGSELLARQMKSKYGRKSIMTKFVRSFWLVSLETGLPFYTVERETRSFIEKVLEFLITLLVSSSPG